MLYKIINITRGQEIVSSARVASNFFSRLLGLMFKKGIKKKEALIFYQAPSIHTFCMRFPIDIIFLDREMKVIRLVRSLKPWRVIICKGASITIELSSGKIAQNQINLGDILEIIS